MSRPTVLFVGHEASRTGAPMVLLHLMRWLKASGAVDLQLLLINGGDLVADYREICPVILLSDSPWKQYSLRWRVLRNAGASAFGETMHARWLRSRLPSPPPSLIYVNTAAAAKAIDLLPPTKVPVVCHIHELDHYLRQILPPTEWETLQRRPTRFIACADAVKQGLVRNGLPAERIDVVHEFIPIPEHNAGSGQEIRRQLQIPDDALVVGGAGQFGWRKGTDLFLQLAMSLRRHFAARPVHCIWLGGAFDHFSAKEIDHDLAAAGLRDRVHFVGVKTNPLDWYAAMDVFVLPSREDPYPLVCLEAASVGRPIVCFAGAGGMPEFVEQDAGRIVPYLDIDAMTTAVIELFSDSALRQCLGQRAAEKVRRRHPVDVGASQILAILQRQLAT